MRDAGNAEPTLETRYTSLRTRRRRADATCVERDVRQLLADKVSGHLVGVWLLAAEHLRFGTWDLLCGWTGRSSEHIEPRLAMQMVQESALCVRGIRNDRTLTNRGGFELANGLPFVASDTAIHQLLASHTIEDAQRLQVALGQMRFASGDFRGDVLLIDPHRMASHSKRRMRLRCPKASAPPTKLAQTFWIVDGDTRQPLCFTTGTSSQNVAQATPALLDLAGEILKPRSERSLVLADAEHCSSELLGRVRERERFDLLVPMTNTRVVQRQLQQIPADRFTPRWAGYATMRRPYRTTRQSNEGVFQYVQRMGERPADWRYKGFLCTADRDEVEPLTVEFPKRWHIEEYFNTSQPLGWKRAGTMNLNIRYGQMSMALIAQAVTRQLRLRLGPPVSDWDSEHFARDVLHGLDGDVRVKDDTIIVTYYNAPNTKLLRQHYEGLPEILERENAASRIPWLYGFKLDFRFR